MLVKEKKIETIEELLNKRSEQTIEELFKDMKTTEEGISIVEVEERLEQYGKNVIKLEHEKSLLKKILEAVINPFNIVLIIIAIVTFITDVVLSTSKSYDTIVLITLTILVSAIISFTQQEKSSKAAKKLQKMISNHVDVIRDGVSTDIDIQEVVPGDIIQLSSGDMIPCDVRFLKTKDLFIDQSSLTGESNPVEKFDNRKQEEDFNLASVSNIGLMGTNIVSGTGIAIALATGNQTYFGNMAKSISQSKSKSSFEKGIDSVSNLLIRFMIVMVPIIFVINLITKDDWIESLLFGITIAVGLTPEMLPVIMTSTLAKGAVNMSKKKTIVKNLGSIQTFGQMDILCTDKTGTLTEDKIILEKYMDVLGNEDTRILKHAFLNSYFQTGLKNLIDVAIIARVEKEGLNILKEKYRREDEIPFDFTRRRMSVVLRDDNGKRQLITKGAVDEVMTICKYTEINGKVEELTESLRKEIYGIYEKYNHDGLRVVAVAQKNEIHDVQTFGTDDESEMVLIGFVGFLDPPKASSKTALEKLKKHGVQVVVLTGDSEGVALNVCAKVGLEVKNKLTGKEIEQMTDEELKHSCEECYLYSKLSPFQKERIVKIYQEKGHTVGFMGDGINDSPALKQSDVGISVDTAVDIAKETADIILLEKDLDVLEEGVIGGRKTFANISKYIKMATSGNFGNMLSMMIAGIFLPFLPLLPIHILIQNLLCDFAQIGMPFDNVDEEYILEPKKWDTKNIKKFMFGFGTISSILDVLCFALLWFALGFNSIEKTASFQTGWFVFGVISQTFIIYMIRTNKIPFIQSMPSKPLMISTLTITAITLMIGFTSIAHVFDMSQLPFSYIGMLLILLLLYAIAIQVFKKVSKYKIV